MRVTGTGRGNYLKGRLIGIDGAVLFPSLEDMWHEMHARNYHDNNTKLKYFGFMCDTDKKGG